MFYLFFLNFNQMLKFSTISKKRPSWVCWGENCSGIRVRLYFLKHFLTVSADSVPQKLDDSSRIRKWQLGWPQTPTAFSWYYRQPCSLYLRLSSQSTSSQTIGRWKSLFSFFPPSQSGRLSFSLSCLGMHLTSDEPTTTPKAVSFFSVLLCLSCGFSQPRLLEKFYFLKLRGWFLFNPATKWICSMWQLGPVGSWTRGRVCNDMQWFLQGEEHRDA